MLRGRAADYRVAGNAEWVVGMVSQAELKFDGPTYEPALDRDRLGRQLKKVLYLMADQKWRTLAEIEAALWEPQASISARLRDLRKPRNGGYTIERRRRGEAAWGIFEYRMVL